MTDERRPFRLPGRSTWATFASSGAPAPPDLDSLLAAVRTAAHVGAAPTLGAGDSLGPVAWQDSLYMLHVTAVHRAAHRMLTEAELAAAALSARVDGTFLVVLYDRVYNVVQAHETLTPPVAERINAAAVQQQRFDCDHLAPDGRAPHIAAIATAGCIDMVSLPALQSAPPAPSPWTQFAAGSHEPRRAPLYLIAEQDPP